MSIKGVARQSVTRIISGLNILREPRSCDMGQMSVDYVSAHSRIVSV